MHGEVAADAGGGDGYEYVANRPSGVVALAEGRNLAPGEAVRLTERLADAFEACIRTERARGHFERGAARVVVIALPSGENGGVNPTLGEGSAIALLCLVAPAKLLSFSPSIADGGTRGIAIEAIWG